MTPEQIQELKLIAAKMAGLKSLAHGRGEHETMRGIHTVHTQMLALIVEVDK